MDSQDTVTMKSVSDMKHFFNFKVFLFDNLCYNVL